MQVEDDVWVTVRYRLYDAQGEEVEPGERELTYLQGGYGAVFEQIEQALAGQQIGFATSVYLEPEDSFGDYDAQRVRLIPRARLPEQLEVGMTFEGVPGEEDGDDDDDGGNLFIVTDITDEAVVLDGNHPLAGMALRFALEVIDLRGATQEEIAAERASVQARDAQAREDDLEFDGDEAGGADDQRPGRSGGRAPRNPRRLH
ncbi:MAG: peptidylprolyl isomerase [Burkholderiaceae bacterium]|nr:peptidylprolyl isomerase [Burkholderiaceae bacterium]